MTYDNNKKKKFAKSMQKVNTNVVNMSDLSKNTDAENNLLELNKSEIVVPSVQEDLTTLPDENNSNSQQLPKDSEKLTENATSPLPQLSKRQIKKLRKLKEWEEKKKVKRLKERAKYKQRKEEAAAKGLPTRTGPSRKELKRNTVEASKNFLKVAVDLDFDNLMIDKDICKCVKQLLRIYTINRRSIMPATLYFTGIQENGRIHQVLEKNDGYQNWDVNWHFKPYIDVLDKDKIIYLTSDSDNILKELDNDVIYIIGGLVDHNHHKGLCFDRAQKLGLKTARLPLNEYVDLKTRTVLSTVHVFEILLRISEGKSWSDSILEVLPMRKGAKLKKDNDSEESS